MTRFRKPAQHACCHDSLAARAVRLCDDVLLYGVQPHAVELLQIGGNPRNVLHRFLAAADPRALRDVAPRDEVLELVRRLTAALWRVPSGERAAEFVTQVRTLMPAQIGEAYKDAASTPVRRCKPRSRHGAPLGAWCLPRPEPSSERGTRAARCRVHARTRARRSKGRSREAAAAASGAGMRE